jgi:spermidine/putrescine-binding protein
MDYICYASPVSAAKEYMEEYLAESEIVYPDEEVLEKGTSYAFLSEETSRYVEGLYQGATKINSDDASDSSGDWLTVVVVLAVAGVGVWALSGKKKKKY